MTSPEPGDALGALLDADRWLERLRAQRVHLPESGELESVEVRLRERLANVHELESARDLLRERYDRVAQESERLRGRSIHLEHALDDSATSPRDYAALQVEAVHARALADERDDEALALLEELNGLDGQLALERLDARPDVARRTELLERITQLRESLDEEMGARRETREQLRRSVASPLGERYDAALTRAGTSGAARVEGGRCDGCRLALAPLDLDRWKSMGPDRFMDCPECGRILLP